LVQSDYAQYNCKCALKKNKKNENNDEIVEEVEEKKEEVKQDIGEYEDFYNLDIAPDTTIAIEIEKKKSRN